MIIQGKRIFLIILIIATEFTCLFGQNSIDFPSSPDPDLYNGRLYSYRNSQIKGHQYLMSPEFNEGSLVLEKSTYKKSSLNYDIYHQEVLLKFENESGIQVISLPISGIHNFSLGNREFIVKQISPWENIIYEIIGEDKIFLLRKWEKEIKVSDGTEIYKYEFSKPKQTTFLSGDLQMTDVTKRRYFLQTFQKKERSTVRKFIRTNHILYRKASNSELIELVKFCNTLWN